MCAQSPFVFTLIGFVVITNLLYSSVGLVRVPVTASPLKLYNGTKIDLSEPCLAYGPILQPSLRDVSAAVTRLTPPPSLQAPPVAWWDKIRYMIHGPLQVAASDVTLIVLPALSFLERTEYLQLGLAAAEVTLRRGKLHALGKYLAIEQVPAPSQQPPFAVIPSVTCDLTLLWDCIGNGGPYAHYVFTPPPPGTPSLQKLPRDVYVPIRSRGLGLGLSVELGPADGDDPPWPLRCRRCPGCSSLPARSMHRTLFCFEEDLFLLLLIVCLLVPTFSPFADVHRVDHRTIGVKSMDALSTPISTLGATSPRSIYG